jgi:hypothetical protein
MTTRFICTACDGEKTDRDELGRPTTNPSGLCLGDGYIESGPPPWRTAATETATDDLSQRYRTATSDSGLFSADLHRKR